MSYRKHRYGCAIADGWTITDGAGQVIAHVETEALADVLLACLRGKMTCQLVKAAPLMRRTLKMVQDWQYERKHVSDDDALNEVALALAFAGAQTTTPRLPRVTDLVLQVLWWDVDAWRVTTTERNGRELVYNAEIVCCAEETLNTKHQYECRSRKKRGEQTRVVTAIGEVYSIDE